MLTHRKESAADIVTYADACMTHDNGMAFYISDMGWNTWDMPELHEYIRHDGSVKDVDINLLEFLACVPPTPAALRAYLYRHPAAGKNKYPSHPHLDRQFCLYVLEAGSP